MNTRQERISSASPSERTPNTGLEIRSEHHYLAREAANAKKAMKRKLQEVTRSAPKALHPVGLWKRHPVGTAVGLGATLAIGGLLVYRTVRKHRRDDGDAHEKRDGAISGIVKSTLMSFGGALLSRMLVPDDETLDPTYRSDYSHFH